MNFITTNLDLQISKDPMLERVCFYLTSNNAAAFYAVFALIPTSYQG
jgi:hypothetical protein